MTDLKYKVGDKIKCPENWTYGVQVYTIGKPDRGGYILIRNNGSEGWVGTCAINEDCVLVVPRLAQVQSVEIEWEDD